MPQLQRRMGQVMDMLSSLSANPEEEKAFLHSDAVREGPHSLVELLENIGLLTEATSHASVSLPPAEAVRKLLEDTTFAEEFSTNQPFYRAGKGAWAVWIVWVLVASPPRNIQETSKILRSEIAAGINKQADMARA